MATKLIIEGNAVYEIDEDCLEYRQKSLGNSKKAVPKNGNGIIYRNNKGIKRPKEEA